MRYARFPLLGLLVMGSLLAANWAKDDGVRAAYNVPDPITSPNTVNSVDIDVDTTGNTPTFVVDVDTAIGNLVVGNSYDIDIVVDEVPPFNPSTFTGGITSFNGDLLYDGTVVSVIGLSHNWLMAAGGGYSPFGSNDSLPDSDGDFRFDRGDVGLIVEDGEGVILRITIKCEAQGTTILSLGDAYAPQDPDIIDAWSDVYPINNVGQAVLACGEPAPPPTDVAVTTVTTTAPAGGQVGVAFTVTSDVTVSNLGGLDPVNVDTAVQLSMPPDCFTGDTNPVTLQDTPVDVAGSPVSLPQQSWSVVCTDPSFHSFTTTATATIDDPVTYELNSSNNALTSAAATTTITAEADLEVTSVSINDLGGQATVNVMFLVDTSVTVNNLDPFDPSIADVAVTLALPQDCNTGMPNPQTAQDVPLPASTPTPVNLLWDVTCSLDSDHLFSASATIAVDQIHVSDPVGGNNGPVSGQDTIPVAPDSDGDGIGDPFDNCPATANPGQADVDLDGVGDACDTEGPPGNSSGLGGQDDCNDGVDNDADGFIDWLDTGCDSDGDGIPDGLDNCPNTSNPNQSDVDADGLGDLCDTEGPSPNSNGLGLLDDCYDGVDNDGDGLIDAFDTGCDSDGDGIPQAFDACPTLPEDIDGFQDADGCPDPDNDMDGVCDDGQTSVSCTGSDVGRYIWVAPLPPAQDCRNVPEDFDAFHDDDGCPEPDNDGDGFPDATDQCPGTDYTAGPDGMADTGDEPQDPLPTLTKEDYDGILDTDGCHDSPGDDFDGDSLSDEDEVFIFFTNPAVADTDGDGIEDGVDGLSFGGDQGTSASSNFTDAPGGTTAGSITESGGTLVSVSNAADPDGVRIRVNGPGGPATIDACGFPLNMPSGTEITITCGSVTAKVITGPVTIHLDTIEASIPTSTTVTVTEVSQGTFDVSNGPQSTGSVSMGGLTLSPGDSVPGVTDGDGDGWVTSVDSCPAVATSWFTPVGDEDCDGFTMDRETYLGTDINDMCASTPSSNDEGPPDVWPVDFNDDQMANMQDVIFAFVTTLAPDGLNQPAAGPLVRVDLNGDGFINMQDVIYGYVTKLAPTGLNTTCTP